jgi:hypothetical protein
MRTCVPRRPWRSFGSTNTYCLRARRSEHRSLRREAGIYVLVNQPMNEHQLPLQATDMLRHRAIFVPSGVGLWGIHVSLSSIVCVVPIPVGDRRVSHVGMEHLGHFNEAQGRRVAAVAPSADLEALLVRQTETHTPVNAADLICNLDSAHVVLDVAFECQPSASRAAVVKLEHLLLSHGFNRDVSICLAKQIKRETPPLTSTTQVNRLRQLSTKLSHVQRAKYSNVAKR